MTIFNQQGQFVTNQYNVAGDLYAAGQDQQVSGLVKQLHELRAMVEGLVAAGELDGAAGGEAGALLEAAVEEVRKPEKAPGRLVGLLTKAEGIMKGVTAAGGIAEGIKQVIGYISKLFV